MSGPKKSQWQIRQEIRDRQRREREVKRRVQVQEIQHKLKICNDNISILISKYGNKVNFIQNRVNDWLNDISVSLNYDLRDAFRGLKGIENYIRNQENKIIQNEIRLKSIRDKKILEEQKKKEMIEEKKRIEEERIKLKKEKANRILSTLTNIKTDYPEIMNKGIEQRIELFSKAIQTNPDNSQTIKQINAFREQLRKEIEKFEEQRDNVDYIKEVFETTLGGDSSSGESGVSVISGNIDGVPISVEIDPKSNNIRFDTPTDGSCKGGMEALVKKLGSANIDLGTIQVIKTGEKLNNTNKSYQSKRLNA